MGNEFNSADFEKNCNNIQSQRYLSSENDVQLFEEKDNDLKIEPLE